MPFSKESDLTDKFFDVATSYFKAIPYLKPSKQSRKQKKPIFLYNYVHVNMFELSTNQSDLAADKYKIIKTIMRCITPLIVGNGHPSHDAAVANNIGSNILYFYDPKKATIISKEDSYVYDTYPPFNIFNYGILKLLNPGNMMGLYSTSTLLSNTKMTLVTISCSLFPSANKYHNGVFTDFKKQLTSPVINYYAPYNLFLVFENEGYIQADTTLKAENKRKVINSYLISQV
jgi:hypothetical protein